MGDLAAVAGQAMKPAGMTDEAWAALQALQANPNMQGGAIPSPQAAIAPPLGQAAAGPPPVPATAPVVAAPAPEGGHFIKDLLLGLMNRLQTKPTTLPTAPLTAEELQKRNAIIAAGTGN